MKIHNYGNDYVQARKFNEVNNDGNRIVGNEPATARKVQTENVTTEEPKTKKANKKKETDNENNV